MSRLIAGFLLGVVSTLAAVFLLSRETSDIPERASSRAPGAETAAEMPPPEPVRSADKAVESNRKSADLAATSAPVVDQSATDAPSGRTEPQAAPAISPSSTASTPATRIEYPAEIGEMIENSVDKELQARYENDAREESWATYMEGQLAAYFAQKPSLAQFYISLIDCRTSVCSIHVLGYGPDALTQWNTATADIVSQPWFEFNNMSMNRRNPEPDILAIVLILTKSPPG